MHKSIQACVPKVATALVIGVIDHFLGFQLLHVLVLHSDSGHWLSVQ